MACSNRNFFYLIVFLSFTAFFSHNFVISSYRKYLVTPSSDRSGMGMKDPRAIKKPFNNHTIMCLILTSQANFDTKAKTIHETWAPLCDNYKFVSEIPMPSKIIENSKKTKPSESEQEPESETESEPVSESESESSMITEIIHNGMTIFRPPGMKADQYDKLTDKVLLTFKYVYKNYGNYDFYLKADDDTFIFMENLRKFLSDKDPRVPATFGYDFKVIVERGYHSGGGGYVLSRQALRRLGAKLQSDYKSCPNSGTEDVDVAKCLRLLGVDPHESIDQRGRERFHPLSLLGHYNGEFPDWMYSYARHPPQQGVKCCSDESISFHYMDQSEIRKLDRIVREQEEKKRKKGLNSNRNSDSNSDSSSFQYIIDEFNKKGS